MIPQFHPAPVPWALSIAYKFEGNDSHYAEVYPGWKPANYPVVGWLYEYVNLVTPMVSYRGQVHSLDVVLSKLKAEALDRAQNQGLRNPGSIDYSLVPA